MVGKFASLSAIDSWCSKNQLANGADAISSRCRCRWPTSVQLLVAKYTSLACFVDGTIAFAGFRDGPSSQRITKEGGYVYSHRSARPNRISTLIRSLVGSYFPDQIDTAGAEPLREAAPPQIAVCRENCHQVRNPFATSQFSLLPIDGCNR